MPVLVLLFPVVFGLTFNTLNMHPQSYADVKADVLKQLPFVGKGK